MCIAILCGKYIISILSESFCFASKFIVKSLFYVDMVNEQSQLTLYLNHSSTLTMQETSLVSMLMFLQPSQKIRDLKKKTSQIIMNLRGFLFARYQGQTLPI